MTTQEPQLTTPSTTTTLTEVIAIAEFTLTVRGERDADIAAAFRRDLEEQIARMQPFLSLVYDVEVEEFEVWTGSRKSKNRVKLKKKKKSTKSSGGLKRTLGALLIGLKLLSADYDQVGENVRKAIQTVEQKYQARGHDVHVDDVQVKSTRDASESPNVSPKDK